MRIQSISANQVYKNQLATRQATPIRQVQEVEKPPVSYIVSFAGQDKNLNQVLSITPESNYLGGIYSKGGLACVADEAPEALKESGLDVRSILPYYSYDDANGSVYVLPEGKDGSKLSDFKKVAQNYSLQNGESFALITDANTSEDKIKKWFKLEDLQSGSVKRMRHDGLDMLDVPYRLFKIVDSKRNDTHYIVHTPELARGKEAYGNYGLYQFSNGAGYGANTGYGANVGYGANTGYGANIGYGASANTFDASKAVYSGFDAGDIFFTDFTRAILDSSKGLANGSEKFNPRSYWLHDRFSYPMIPEIVQRSQTDDFFAGARFAAWLHNPGRDKQGVYANPLDFFRVVATEKDLEELKKRKDFPIIEKLSKQILEGKKPVTGEAAKQLDSVFRTRLSGYIDDFGMYNLTKVPIHHTGIDPEHFVVGTVSNHFGDEMTSKKTSEVAEGLTESLNAIKDKTRNVTNGSRPANMETDNQKGFFGTGKLRDIMHDTTDDRHYRTYSKNDSLDAVLEAKETNKKNLLNILADATAEAQKEGGTQDSIADLFFSADRKAGIRGAAKDDKLPLVLGGMSSHKDGDLLFASWGRPDPQKGFPVLLESIKKFYSNESIPLEQRLRAKFLLGAGGGDSAFADNASEFKLIKKALEDINSLAGGKFKNHVMYVNGLFPKRIANCVDATIFTSRYEPCGITPFESFASGAPVISTNTGGAPDFISSKVGYLTKDPFMLEPDELGIPKEEIQGKSFSEVKAIVDKYRRERIGGQISDKIGEYVTTHSPEKQKEFIKNCFEQKTGWRENNAYNGGKDAVSIIKEDVFKIQKMIEKSYVNTDNKFGPEMTIKPDDVVDNAKFWTKTKVGVAVGVAVVALGTLYHYYTKNNSGKKELDISPLTPNNSKSQKINLSA